jgi:transcription initiation factor TFIIF subunit beta
MLEIVLTLLFSISFSLAGVVKMVGTVANEAALKPQMATTLSLNGGVASASGITPEYREVLRKRRIEASKPKHSVKVIDETDISRRNMMTSGVGNGFTRQTKVSLIPSKANVRKNQTEKFARMPRNELLDMLFELFEEYPYWSIKGLRNKVQQPEVYLREVLMSVADYHRVGPYASLWSLKAEYQAMRKRGELDSGAAAGAVASGSQVGTYTDDNKDGSSPHGESAGQI